MLFNYLIFCNRPVLIYLHARELFMFLFSSADSLDPDQGGRSVGLHLGSNCLQKAIGRRRNSPQACKEL